MLANVEGLQKDLEDVVNSCNQPPQWIWPLPEEAEILVETLLVPSLWPALQVTCRGPISADGLLHLSAQGASPVIRSIHRSTRFISQQSSALQRLTLNGFTSCLSVCARGCMFSEGKACVLCGFPAPLGHRACPVTELSTYIAQNNYS